MLQDRVSNLKNLLHSRVGVCLMGDAGAGKSTTYKVLARVINLEETIKREKEAKRSALNLKQVGSITATVSATAAFLMGQVTFQHCVVFLYSSYRDEN